MPHGLHPGLFFVHMGDKARNPCQDEEGIGEFEGKLHLAEQCSDGPIDIDGQLFTALLRDRAFDGLGHGHVFTRDAKVRCNLEQFDCPGVLCVEPVAESREPLVLFLVFPQKEGGHLSF